MRAILFDFGGTLDFPGHWLDRFLAHYRASGIDIERTELDSAFSIATRKAYGCSAKLREYSLSRLVGFLVELQFEHLFTNGAGSRCYLVSERIAFDLSKLHEQICDRFVAESMTGFRTSRGILASLARRFKIGVVSNFYGNLERVLAEADLAHMVSATADSGRLGFYKPDQRIFMAALAQLGVNPQDAVMVGDSDGKDCAPAKAMGMRTVWLRHPHFNDTKAAPSGLVDCTIDSLGELENFEWLTA
jgi:putative hydrolase of the HAD superfamily